MSGSDKHDERLRLGERAAIVELLPEYALGMLDEADTRAIEAAIAADPTLRADLRAWQDTAAQLALALPSIGVARRVWAGIEEHLERPRPFAAFVARVAQALEIGETAARRLLDRVDAASSWVKGPSASSHLYHVEPGASIVAIGGIAGFVRVDAGAAFPHHKHLGEEYVLVLQGGFRDDDGKDYGVGDESRQPAGTAHTFVAHAGAPLVYLAVVRGQIDFGDGFEL